MLFYRLLQEVVATEPIPLNKIEGGHVGRSRHPPSVATTRTP